MNGDPKNPKVGDVFVTHIGHKATITAVGRKRVLYVYGDPDDECTCGLDRVADWQPVPARPTVVEQWGRLTEVGIFIYHRNEDDARLFCRPSDTPARICHLAPEELVQFGDLFAVVCDEHGNPIPIEIPS